MSSLQKESKIYGAVESQSYITFTGFCKRIYDTTQQSVDVFIDDVKIDTIQANQKIADIENKYEVFDTNGFCFTYTLPKEYIGQKHKLEFKTKDGEQLVHSPIITIDSSNEKYNEYTFIESLNEPIDEEKIKDKYCPNSIGFLATEENLEDKEFVEYIKQIILDFQNSNFKVLILNNNLNEKIKNIFDNLESIEISSLYDIFANIEVYLSNNDRNELDTKILMILRKYSTDIFSIGLGLNQKEITIRQYELKNQSYFSKFFNNLKYLGFEMENLEKYGNTFYEIYYKKAIEKYNVNINFDLDENLMKAEIYWNLKLGLHNHDFFKYSLDFAKKFSKL